MPFTGFGLDDPVPNAKTIWLLRKQLPRSGAMAKLFERLNQLPHPRDYLPMSGQIADATVIEARKPRLSREKKVVVLDAGTPSGWSKVRTRQIDYDGQRPLKRSKKPTSPEDTQRKGAGTAVPVFGYKNHVDIDRRRGFIRRFVVTHAACQDGSQLAGLLDATNAASEVRADAAYRSRTNLTGLDKRSLIAQFRRAKTRAIVRSRVQHVFAAGRRRM